MKLFSNDRFNEILAEAKEAEYSRAFRNVKRQYTSEIKDLEDALADSQAENKTLTKKVKNLEAEIETLNKERADTRELAKQRIELEDRETEIEAVEESLERRAEKLDERESKIGDKEEGQYKTGYADGVADGVRKINEITAQDRENAMKVAMVAAASHSTPEVIRELNNGTKALTEGTKNTEDK